MVCLNLLSMWARKICFAIEETVQVAHIGCGQSAVESRTLDGDRLSDGGLKSLKLRSHQRNGGIVHRLVLVDFHDLLFQTNIAAVMKENLGLCFANLLH